MDVQKPLDLLDDTVLDSAHVRTGVDHNCTVWKYTLGMIYHNALLGRFQEVDK